MKNWILTIALFFCMLGTAFAQATPTATPTSCAMNPCGGLFKSINGVYLYADQYPGSTIDAKIAAAENDCQIQGCTIDASNISGPQTWNSTVVISKPTVLKLNGQISYTGAPLTHGLIQLADEIGSGADISCANGLGINPVWPPIPNNPGGPITLNPPDLLSRWQCYILTNPTGPVASVNISSITVSGTTATVTASGAVPFTAGDGVRLAGVTPDVYNEYVIVQSVSGNTFTYNSHPSQGAAASGGTAKKYMPVIETNYSTSNINIHDMNFVANANTGSVIRETGGNRLGLGIVNNHYNRNQFINTDGIGNQGYAIEISSISGLGENTNQKEIAWNSISGLAGCYFIDQSLIVVADIHGNECAFPTNAPSLKLDSYQKVQTQNTRINSNIWWASLGPANHPVIEIDSGYNIDIRNNDFELPNMLQKANVDFIEVHQGTFFYLVNNAFLSTAGQNAGRFSISFDNTDSAGHAVIDGNHSSGGETTFINDPVCVGCGFQGYLNYGNNEDFNRAPGPNTQLYPSVAQYTGSGSGVPYTTTSASFVSVDPARLVADFYIPSSGYSAIITGSGQVFNSGTQAGCLALKDLVSNSLMTYKIAAPGTSGSQVGVQYIITPAAAASQQHWQIALSMASCGGLGTTTVANNDGQVRPTIIVNVIPSHGGSN